MGTMNIHDKTGHSVVTWEETDTTQVDLATEAFASLMEQAYIACVVEEGVGRRTIDEFDPSIKHIEVFPALVGG